MKKQITSVSLVQTAKVAAVIYFVFGVVAAVFLLLFAMFAPGQRMGGVIGAILTPFIYAFFGFVFVFIGAWIYNQVAKRVGGIEFTLSDVSGGY